MQAARPQLLAKEEWEMDIQTVFRKLGLVFLFWLFGTALL